MWTYKQPVTVLFGNGTIQQVIPLAHQRGWKRGIVVATPHVVANSVVDDLVRQGKEILTDVFSHITPNPDVQDVDDCADIIRKGTYDFVVAIGGGSAIDLAKAAASVGCTPDSIRLYHGTGRELPPKHVPLVAVPTTAGTGSEVTSVAVLSDIRQHKKSPIASDNFFPEYAIIDPELTYDMPAYLTACCGMDVLSHALEGYWSIHHQPICDIYAVHAASLVFQYLRQACQQPKNAEAREKLCEASVIAGMSFALPKTTASHACSFPLTNQYHIPHGEACGLTLDYFARLNGQHDIRVQQLAHQLGFQDSEVLGDEIFQLKKDIGLRTDLRDLQLDKKAIQDLVAASHHPNVKNNPYPITDEILQDLYQRLV